MFKIHKRQFFFFYNFCFFLTRKKIIIATKQQAFCIYYCFLQVDPPFASANYFDEQTNVVYYHADVGQFSIKQICKNQRTKEVYHKLHRNQIISQANSLTFYNQEWPVRPQS